MCTKKRVTNKKTCLAFVIWLSFGNDDDYKADDRLKREDFSASRIPLYFLLKKFGWELMHDFLTYNVSHYLPT